MAWQSLITHKAIAATSTLMPYWAFSPAVRVRSSTDTNKLNLLSSNFFISLWSYSCGAVGFFLSKRLSPCSRGKYVVQLVLKSFQQVSQKSSFPASEMFFNTGKESSVILFSYLRHLRYDLCSFFTSVDKMALCHDSSNLIVHHYSGLTKEIKDTSMYNHISLSYMARDEFNSQDHFVSSCLVSFRMF